MSQSQCKRVRRIVRDLPSRARRRGRIGLRRLPVHDRDDPDRARPTIRSLRGRRVRVTAPDEPDPGGI